MIYKTKKINSGSAILETIFYVVLFSVFSITLINSMFVMTRAFKETSIQKELMQSGNILERISREIRKAESISSLSSNNLKLNSKDDLGEDKTVEFSLFNSSVRFLENDLFTGNLNSSSIVVTSLDFIQINTTRGVAVRIVLGVRSSHDSQNRVENFYSTVVLRGSY